MLRRKTDPPWRATPDENPPSDPDPGDGALGTGVPRRPTDSSGSAGAAEVPLDDAPASGDMHQR
jgi:hypothetical protein